MQLSIHSLNYQLGVINSQRDDEDIKVNDYEYLTFDAIGAIDTTTDKSSKNKSSNILNKLAKQIESGVEVNGNQEEYALLALEADKLRVYIKQKGCFARFSGSYRALDRIVTVCNERKKENQAVIPTRSATPEPRRTSNPVNSHDHPPTFAAKMQQAGNTITTFAKKAKNEFDMLINEFDMLIADAKGKIAGMNIEELRAEVSRRTDELADIWDGTKEVTDDQATYLNKIFVMYRNELDIKEREILEAAAEKRLLVERQALLANASDDSDPDEL